MDMVKFSSSQKISFDSSTHLKNVSFSSYPSSADETAFANNNNNNNNNTISRITSPVMVTTAQEDGEIRVFGAEKYFNGRMDSESHKNTAATTTTTRQIQINQSKKEAKTDPMIITPKQPTPANNHHPHLGGVAMSTRSESSWNSQRALLHKRSAKKSRSRSFLRSLSSCNCACADKNSIDVAEEQEHEQEQEQKQKQGQGQGHVGEISFRKSKDQDQDQEPVPGEGYVEKMDRLVIGEPNLLSPKAQFHFGDVQKARKSLEVFGSPVMDKRSRSFKLSWESNPRKMEEFPNNNGIYSYESGSDASSDLFEIESLTGKGNNPFLASSGCATPVNGYGYAPSEASIEWSVITASAADHEEHQRNINAAAINTRDHKTGGKVMAQRRRPNILLSCKSHKSVRVAGDAYVAATGRVNADQMTPVARLQGQLGRSHSPRASHLLYIQ